MFDVVFGDPLALAPLLLGSGYLIEGLQHFHGLAWPRSWHISNGYACLSRTRHLWSKLGRAALILGYGLMAATKWGILP